MHNRTGAKGAITVRFGFEDSTFCFLNCHLAGGNQPRNVDERHQQLNYIMNEAYKGDRGTQYQSYQVQNHNVKVFFGDLNFRINKSRKEVRTLVANRHYATLMKADELYVHGMRNNVLKTC